MTAKRIGFVDDDLDNFHANTYLSAMRGPLASRGWEVVGATGLQAEKSAAWAAEKGVAYFETVADLAAAVDVIAILAPSTPETHEALAAQVLPHGKTTFIDKTFAPDTAAAERIFALADSNRVAVQSTSALRTTAIQTQLDELEGPLVNLGVWAGGASFAEYGVHPVEIAVSCLGPEVERLTVAGAELHPTIAIEFSRGRVATIDFNSAEYAPFVAMLTTERWSQHVVVDDKRLFIDAAAAILDFFDAGQPLVLREETLAVMRILDAAKRPAARDGWVAV
jgi:predicted dehydrogenase